ncbi:MAG: RNA polymerase sigma factor [Gammaproteobacteria bacterium]|nr:RNA polymerase sigma factor [Gammaproteobacteria bacterium]
MSSTEDDKFTTLFLKHKSQLRQFLSRYLQQSHDLEDVVNETYLRVFLSQRQGKKLSYPKAYMFKTARNLALKHLDRNSNKIVGQLVDQVDEQYHLEGLINEISSEDAAISEQSLIHFIKAVETLPDKCRKIFILRKIHGNSHKEIAKTMNIAKSTVENQLAIALSKCHHYFDKHNINLY